MQNQLTFWDHVKFRLEFIWRGGFGGEYSPEWDQVVNEALDAGIPVKVNPEPLLEEICRAQIGDAVIWVFEASYPRRYGHADQKCGGELKLKPLTAYRLRKVVRQEIKKLEIDQNKDDLKDSEKFLDELRKTVFKDRADFVKLVDEKN